MTFTELQARATLLASFGGWSDVSPAPTWSSLVNEAWRQFSWDAECVIATGSMAGVAGQTVYTLSSGPWKQLLDVSFNSVGLVRSSETFEACLDPGFRTQAQGTPLRWVLSGFDTLILVPPPSGTQNITWRGVKQGADMSAGGDVPGGNLPAAFHEAIAARAAWLQGIAYSQGQENERLAQLEARYQELVAKCREHFRRGWMRSEAGEAK